MFGQARKPYCIAGIRWLPTKSVLFTCDLFSDDALELCENAGLLQTILYEAAWQKFINSQWRPDYASDGDIALEVFVQNLLAVFDEDKLRSRANGGTQQ